MDIRISGHQIDTGTALQQHATDRLEALRTKYFARALSAHATFTPGGSGHDVDIVMHVNRGLILKAHGSAQDIHQAFDVAHAKLEKQLRRYKNRLQDHHQEALHAKAQEEAAYTVFAAMPDDEPEAEQESDAPLVVAETTADIPEASVADAVMMLDLRDTNALLFKNAKTGRHNMIYRRRDETIGWVEPR